MNVEALTLIQYNNRIKRLVNDPSVHVCWVMAETSDLRVSRGHCYLELIQKDDTGATVARLGAAIWASTFAGLNDKFYRATGKPLASGMKVMVNVTANFHELYGMKAFINDIDPSYTLGDMERIRREIIAKLTSEGIIDMNKQLPWGLAPQRIAVISARGAAGYGDFLNQLHNNDHGLKFIQPCINRRGDPLHLLGSHTTNRMVIHQLPIVLILFDSGVLGTAVALNARRVKDDLLRH